MDVCILLRDLSCAYMPEDAKFNGIKNILSDEEVSQLKIGDLLNDHNQNLLVYSKSILPGRQ